MTIDDLVEQKTRSNHPEPASAVPSQPDALLTREGAADALTEAGFPTAAATLATKATRGGGPPFRLYGRRPLYRWGDALDWARSRLSNPIRNTSELDAARPAQAG